VARAVPIESTDGPERVAEPATIRNLESLLDHGDRGARRLALDVAAAGLAACDPALAVERLVAIEGDRLVVAGRAHELRPGGRIVVLGSGKASLKIGVALERILGDRIAGGTIVVRHAPAGRPLQRLELLEASHPLPDGQSVSRARRLLEQAAALGADDILIACFTGGSSALTSLPPPGVPDADKRELHRILLGSGIPITEVNAVRKQVSAFKGGRLALAAQPATVINLTISDVAGDALDVITDPTVQNSTTVADALRVLHGHGLWDEIPESVRRHLSDPRLETPDLSGVEIHSTLLVTGEMACEAMAAAARAAGTTATVLSTSLEEEAAPAGRLLASLAVENALRGRPFPGSRVIVGCGGESTVRLGPADEFGAGGPNQEAALAAARKLEGSPVAIVLLDTDGSDGGTEVAGAVADGTTRARAREAGIDLRAALAGHRSGEAVAALGDAIVTGPTHTNVNDLFVAAIGEPA
jgi:glycerate-2-kinase